MSESPTGPFTSTLDFDCTPLGVNVVYLQVTDAHGNTSDPNVIPCTANVTIQDVTNPVVVSTPGNAKVSCSTVGGDVTDIPAITAYVATLADATFSDNCSVVNITETFGVTPGTCPNSFTINRVWEAVDGSGQTVQAIQNITVQDATKPSITLPANVTLNLSSFANCTPSVAYTATLADGCSSGSFACHEHHLGNRLSGRITSQYNWFGRNRYTGSRLPVGCQYDHLHDNGCLRKRSDQFNDRNRCG